jgi:hypothetical protein
VAKRYVVTGEYVTLNTAVDGVTTVVGRYRGAAVPPDIPDWQRDHLLGRGLIAEVPADAPVPPPPGPSVEEQVAAQGAPADDGDDGPARAPRAGSRGKG